MTIVSPHTPASWRTQAPRADGPVVERPRCQAALRSATALRPVVVVAAPPGFGKTTVVTRWAAQDARPTAWVTLDPFDDDAERLLGVVAAAVAAAHPGAAHGLPAAVRAAAGSTGRVLDALVSVLTDLGERALVVLDDVHLLTSPAARHAVATLLRTPGPRFVLVGRYVPDLALGRGRLAGQVGDLGTRVLALTPRETSDLVRAWGGPADPDVVADLWRATGGWPVAVRAACAAGVLHRGRPQRALRPQDVPVDDYVREEVLGALPSDVGTFLRRACVGRVLDPPLAEALAPGGARLLEECVGRGLLPPDASRALPWHDVLATHVRVVVGRTEPSVVRTVHRALARHVAGTDPAAAVRHAVEGHAPELAHEVLGERWPELLARSSLGAAVRLCGAVPAQAGGRDVATATAVSRALRGESRPEDHDAAAALVVRALVGADAPTTPHDLLAAATQGDATGTVVAYLVGRAALHASDTPVAGVPAERCGRGGLQHVVDALADAAEVAAVRGWPVLALACRAEHALACARSSRVAEARARAQGVLGDAAALGPVAAPATAAAHLAAGLVAFWCDEQAPARRHLTAAAQAASTRPALAARAAAVLVHVCLADGDPAGVADVLAMLERRAPAGISLAFLVAAQHDAHGEPRDALALVDLADPAFTSPTGVCRRSDLHRRTGDRAAALAALAGVPDDPAWHVADTVALHASRALLREEPAAAHRDLERALDAAAPDGVVRPLRDRAAALRPLLLAHLGRGSSHEGLVTRLLAADRDAPAPRGSAWTLTERELQALACLPSRMTLDEVAASLFVSVNTVKTHVRAVYRKLGVTSRRDAVRTAVERGLL
ncbi:LuxR family transcriptional regulator [Cellulomonas xiejunii]|uniref:LuxR family transcriptional regulator n=1 Tax=Cellulomonas xiejunii TaxID=2968083 RepID=UPI001D0DDB2C|nr:LuxR family transcriptional regulator [Cellulomonas xiejunii]MCC2314738.1 LuxR C-terminal-related transcriptional regulator [Cellulomonas xiejunii]